MRFLRRFKYVITFLLIIFIIVVCFINKNRLIKNSNIVKEDKKEESLSINNFDNFRVEIKGAVKKPGVYEVNEDMIVNDLIDLAGGLNDDADTSIINLAKKLKNEDLIIIYTKEQVKNSNIVDTVVKEVMGECICPNIQNDGCINDEIDDTISNYKKDEVVKNDDNYLININTASLEELMKINGIGETKAKAIIEYRKKNKFNKIEDILNVNGIGQALYEKIKDSIRV